MKDRIVACIDMGTTRTRVWITRDGQVLGSTARDFGARDTAKQGKAWLSQQLVELLSGIDAPRPHFAIAAGMITSSNGLVEVPHIAAPAGPREIAHGMYMGELNGLPLLLVPGVKYGRLCEEDGDIMRGEEVLCVGLSLAGLFTAGAWVVTLGSHWKWIQIDEDRQIISSSTSIAGELIHVAQCETLLAASLPQQRPTQFDEKWLRKGMITSRNHSVGHSLFRVRLLDLSGSTTATERISFFYGVLIQNELKDALERWRKDSRPVWVSGNPALTSVWKSILDENGVQTAVLAEHTREACYLRGLEYLASLRSA